MRSLGVYGEVSEALVTMASIESSRVLAVLLMMKERKTMRPVALIIVEAPRKSALAWLWRRWRKWLR